VQTLTIKLITIIQNVLCPPRTHWQQPALQNCSNVSIEHEHQSRPPSRDMRRRKTNVQ